MLCQSRLEKMSPEEFEAACQAAVAQWKYVPMMEHVARLDKETGKVIKVDGRVDSQSSSEGCLGLQNDSHSEE